MEASHEAARICRLGRRRSGLAAGGWGAAGGDARGWATARRFARCLLAEWILSRSQRLGLRGAGWHGAKDLKAPSNISLLPLPPRSPELNPQENIWQFMRTNWLSNRVFKSFDDIVDHCCYAWNTLIDQPWKIMSIARRDWALAGHSL
jgi:hypothetical protein